MVSRSAAVGNNGLMTESKAAIDAAALSWYKKARSEWNTIAPMDVLYNDTRFVWASAAVAVVTSSAVAWAVVASPFAA